MPLSTIINKLFVKGNSPQTPAAVEVVGNSIGAISTAPGFLTGKVSLPVGTPSGYTVMLNNGDPTFQQLILTVNTTAAAVGAQFILEGTSNPTGGTLGLGWTSLQYIFQQANTSTGTGISGFISTIAQQIGSPSGRTNTLSAGIAGMSYVRLRLTVAVTTNPLELAWSVITTASVPPVPNPSIGSGGGVVDGSGLSEAMLTGGSQANPVLAVTPMLSQGATNTLVYQRTPTTFKTASVAATATGNSAAWTPAAGKKFRLMRFQITAQGLAATATGVVTVSFQDSASGITIGTYDVDVPAVAGVVSGVSNISCGWVDLGNGFLSAAANNVLNFNISAAGAGTVGTYRVNVCGTEE